jgi:hypothetical protein
MKLKRYEVYSINVFELYQTGVSFTDSRDLLVKSYLLKQKTVHENPLFDQIKIFLDENGYNKNSDNMIGLDSTDKISEVIVYLEFDEMFLEMNKDTKTRSLERFFESIFKDGITISINNEKIKFLPFEKSAGMSRESTMAFIRSTLRIKDKTIDLRPEIRKRIMLDLQIEKAQLSKLFAYNGLMLSSGKRIEGLNLSEKNVAVVKDLKPKKDINCITAISFQTLNDLIKEIYSNPSNYETGLNTLIDYIAKISKVSDADRKRLTDLTKINIESNDINSSLKTLNSINDFLKTNNYVTINDRSNNQEQFWYYIKANLKIEINFFDGVGLISTRLGEKLSEIIGDGRKYTSFQIRLPYIKGMIHKVDFHGFYKEAFPNANDIECLDGLKRKIEDIDLILTESQFKGYKWIKRHLINSDSSTDVFEYYWNRIKKYNHSLYISGVNKNYTQEQIKINYQFLHTPKFKKEEFNSLVLRSRKFLEDVSTNENYQINFFLNGKNNNDLSLDKPLDETDIYDQVDMPNSPIEVENTSNLNIMQKALLKNKKLIRLNGFQNKIKDLIDSEAVDFALSRLNVRGEMRYLSSDLFYFLHFIIGEKINNNDDLLLSRFYAPKKEDGINYNKDKYYVLLRNPHLTRNEDVALKPYTFKNTLRNKYFSHLTSVIMINPENLIAEKLGGADYDGDLIKIIDDVDYVNAVLRQNSTSLEGEYPLIKIPSSNSSEAEFNLENEISTIKNTFSSRIGLICNNGFRYSVNGYNENNEDLEYSFKKKLSQRSEEYSILAGLEIDSSKNGSKPYLPKLLEEFNNEENNSKIKELVKQEYYLKLKGLVLKNKLGNKTKKEIEEFSFDDRSPNLYSLPSTALKIKKNSSEFRKENSTKFENIFKFEAESDWVTKLDNKILEKMNILLLVMRNLFKKYNIYNTSKKFSNIDNASMKLDFILNSQYGGNTIDLPSENIRIKMQNIDYENILTIYDRLCEREWQFLIDNKEKENTLIELFGNNFFDPSELKLLNNFNESGFEIVYLYLKSVINQKKLEQREEYYEKPSVDFDNSQKILLKYLRVTTKISETEATNIIDNMLDFFITDRETEIISILNSKFTVDIDILKRAINKFFLNTNPNDSLKVKTETVKKYFKDIDDSSCEEIVKELTAFLTDNYFKAINSFDKFFYINNKKYIDTIEKTVLKSKDNYSDNLENTTEYRELFYKLNKELIDKKVIRRNKSSYYSVLVKIIQNEISSLFGSDSQNGFNTSLHYFVHLVQKNKDLDSKGTLLWDIYKETALNNMMED